MTQNSNTAAQPTVVPANIVTADLLRNTDLDTIVIRTPSGRILGDTPSLAFGLGSWEGDHEGFAAWLRVQG
jgi:hypothetical protein